MVVAAVSVLEEISPLMLLDLSTRRRASVYFNVLKESLPLVLNLSTQKALGIHSRFNSSYTQWRFFVRHYRVLVPLTDNDDDDDG